MAYALLYASFGILSGIPQRYHFQSTIIRADDTTMYRANEFRAYDLRCQGAMSRGNGDIGTPGSMSRQSTTL